MKQYSQSCDENREPILKIIRDVFCRADRVLEIGSGTGQHAVYFARQMPQLVWQPSDLADSHASINAWRLESGLDNVPPPLLLDVTDSSWPVQHYDVVYSANTAHIMGWHAVESMFAGIGRLLPAGAHFCLYGPFNYGGQFTSTSNMHFDAWLKDRDPQSGVRDFEAVDALATAAGMVLMADNEMPVNNRLLVWRNTGT